MAYINGATTVGDVALSPIAVVREGFETTDIQKFTEDEWKTSDTKNKLDEVADLLKDAFMDGGTTIGEIASSDIAVIRESITPDGMTNFIEDEWKTSHTKNKMDGLAQLTIPGEHDPKTLTLLSSEMDGGEHTIVLQRADGKTIRICVPDDGYGEDTFTDKDSDKKDFGLNFVTNGHYV
jgi:hypothetical protein